MQFWARIEGGIAPQRRRTAASPTQERIVSSEHAWCTSWDHDGTGLKAFWVIVDCIPGHGTRCQQGRLTRPMPERLRRNRKRRSAFWQAKKGSA